MLCDACGSEIDVKGLFPMAKVHCTCGVVHVVPRTNVQDADTLPSAGPYRMPAAKISEPPPVAVSDSGGRVKVSCPRCHSPLDSAEGPPGCRRCGGVFLDRGDLERLRASSAEAPFRVQAPEVLERVATEPLVKCPYCASLMNRQVLKGEGGVVVDICAKHGTWFDGGELAAVARAEETRTTRTTPETSDEAPRTYVPRPPKDDAEARAVIEVAVTHASTWELMNERRDVRMGAWFAADLIADLLKIVR